MHRFEPQANGSELKEDLLSWFHTHARDLPWRSKRTPYRVWISELMLQQTQVQTVLPYYARFMKAFPDLQALAEAPLEKVLKLWEGLGYYRRARQLHAAAQFIHHDLKGIFPSSYEGLLQLPGVGPYTAAAIYAFAFQGQAAAVDGNVFRVAARLLNQSWQVGDIKALRSVQAFVLSLIDETNSARINEALIELGATVCTKRPRCHECPLTKHCLGYQQGHPEQIPRPKKAILKKKEAWTFLILSMEASNRFWVEQRPEEGLLAGLWQFPALEGHPGEDQLIDQLRAYGLLLESNLQTLPSKKHIFSHIEWQMEVFWAKVSLDSKERQIPKHWLEVTVEELIALPFSSALTDYRHFVLQESGSELK